MKAVDYQEIAPDLERLAAGGEGVVYRLRSRPRLVFKEYKEAQRPTLNVAALTGLIESVDAMPAPDRQRFSDRTIWPSHLVVRNGEVLGFLMPSIDSSYYCRYGLRANPKVVLCDWNQLIYHQGSGSLPPHMVSEVPTASPKERTGLVKDLAETLAVIHRSNLIVGDMSGKNLLWTLAPARVVFIDCDSFRLDGAPGACAHKESPGWVDPTLQGAPTTRTSDIYKLGVAAYRSLWNDPSSVVTPDVVRRQPADTIASTIVELVASSVGPVSSRPTAQEWVTELSAVARFDGRPRIVAPTTPPTAAPRTRPRLTSRDTP